MLLACCWGQLELARVEIDMSAALLASSQRILNLENPNKLKPSLDIACSSAQRNAMQCYGFEI